MRLCVCLCARVCLHFKPGPSQHYCAMGVRNLAQQLPVESCSQPLAGERLSAAAKGRQRRRAEALLTCSAIERFLGTPVHTCIFLSLRFLLLFLICNICRSFRWLLFKVLGIRLLCFSFRVDFFFSHCFFIAVIFNDFCVIDCASGWVGVGGWQLKCIILFFFCGKRWSIQQW